MPQGYPIPGVDGAGVPQVQMGGTPSQVWMGLLHPADRGRLPHPRSGWGYPIAGPDAGYPIPGPNGGTTSC